MQQRFLSVLAMAIALAANPVRGQMPGNVWHLPRNAEPAGVNGMRNPPCGILTNTAVTLHNGSFAFNGVAAVRAL